jgi:hypothetical protein
MKAMRQISLDIARQKNHNKISTPLETVQRTVSIPPVIKPAGEARTIAAKATGFSEASLYRAEAVIKAAERDPTTFGDLPTKMDASGNISGTYSEMKRREHSAAPEGGTKQPQRRLLDRPHLTSRYQRLAATLELHSDFFDRFGSVNMGNAQEVVAAIMKTSGFTTNVVEPLPRMERLGRRHSARSIEFDESSRVHRASFSWMS